MKPSQLASQLRRIAAAIDKSRNPDRNLVARDLKKVIAAVDGASAGSIIIHTHGDHEMYDVARSVSITSNMPFDSLTLPKGDVISIAKSLDDIKANMDMTNEALLDALFNAGLIDTDEDGNHIL